MPVHTSAKLPTATTLAPLSAKPLAGAKSQCSTSAPVPLRADVMLRQTVGASRRQPRLTEVQGVRATVHSSPALLDEFDSVVMRT